MRKQTKKQADTFRAMTIKALVSLGAVPSGSTMYQFRLETIHGLLHLSPCDNAIRTRFDDIPAVPPAGAPLNPYSGKWNFELSDKPDDRELAVVIHSIRRILPQRKES